MRLSQDKSRRLTAMVWRERVKRWVPVALVLVLLFTGATYMLSNQLSKADKTLAEIEQENSQLTDQLPTSGNVLVVSED